MYLMQGIEKLYLISEKKEKKQVRPFGEEGDPLLAGIIWHGW